MKKIMFGYQVSDAHVPFWKPWGCMGCLGNLFIFVLLLTLLVVLLGLLRRCDGRSSLPSEFPQPGKVYQPTDSVPEDTAEVDTTWNQPIAGAEEVGLPSPGDNNIPRGDDPVPNPDDGGKTEIVPNLLYVILDSDTDDETFKAFAAKFTSLYKAPEHTIEYYNSSAKTCVLKVPEASRSQICSKLPSQIAEAKFLVVPVEVLTEGAAGVPDDPAFRYPKLSWYFQPIQAFDAWSITQGSEDVVVGIVDSYMDLAHDELAGGRCIYPFSVVEGTANVAPKAGLPMDAAGHGSFVTSVAVGNSGNGAGSSGIAPKCRFIPVSMGAVITTVTEVEGLLYCMYHGADVINLSCGTKFAEGLDRQMSVEQQVAYSREHGKPQQAMWEYVFSLAEERNVTIVWSAGNDNLYAGMDDSKRSGRTICVSAVDRNLHKADFSNHGNYPKLGVAASTISAPGVDILGALPGNTYDLWPGTSFSAPIITGVVALMKSINANLTTKEIIDILQATGRPVEGAPEIGKLVQIKDALLKVRSMLTDFSTNPNKLLGTWETTSLTTYVDDNGRPTGNKGKVRITIQSPTTAVVKYCILGGKVYTAPATVKISSNRVDIQQTQIATAPGNDDSFHAHLYTLTPGEGGKTKCTTKLRGELREENYIRKIS